MVRPVFTAMAQSFDTETAGASRARAVHQALDHNVEAELAELPATESLSCRKGCCFCCSQLVRPAATIMSRMVAALHSCHSITDNHPPTMCRLPGPTLCCSVTEEEAALLADAVVSGTGKHRPVACMMASHTHVAACRGDHYPAPFGASEVDRTRLVGRLRRQVSRFGEEPALWWEGSNEETASSAAISVHTARHRIGCRRRPSCQMCGDHRWGPSDGGPMGEDQSLMWLPLRRAFPLWRLLAGLWLPRPSQRSVRGVRHPPRRLQALPLHC